MKKYTWLIVMKNSKEYLIDSDLKTMEELLNCLLPTELNEIKWTTLQLTKPIDGQNTVVINGGEVSSVLYTTTFNE